MNQQGDNSNFVQVRGGGDGSTYHVTQNNIASGTPNYVKLQIDKDSIRKYPKAELEKGALRGAGIITILAIISFIGAFAKPLIGVFADSLSILSFFELNKTSIAVISIGLAIVLTVFTARREEQSIVCFVYWIRSMFMGRNESKLVGLNNFLEVDSEGNLLTYSLSNLCNYPGCNGKIIVMELPPREKHRDGFAGICSAARTAHSYYIDYNDIAVRKDIDWRPLDPPGYYNPGYRR